MSLQPHSREPEIVRDPRLARLLGGVETPEILRWSEVEAIVAAAPPARVTWLHVLSAPAAGLRYSLATLLMLALGSGVLAVVPAQADRIGTILTVDLPGAWSAGSPQMAEFESAARGSFAALPEAAAGELAVLNVTQGGGRPRLALVLREVDGPAAAAWFDALAADFPALAAYPYEVDGIESARGSLLQTLLARSLGADSLAGLSESEARVQVLRSLGRLGLTPTSVTTSRRADGTLVIEISAQLPIEVEGHTQEDMRRAGLSRDVLGADAYEQLLELAAQQ